jgi:cholest-4-en-3-one 26-monooxygenase
VVHDLAAQLPSRLTADLLGFPERRWEDIRSWSERLMRTDAITFDNDALMGVMNAIVEFNALLQETAAARTPAPPTT